MDMINQTEEIPNEGVGFLIVRATTARGAIPVEGARVNVRNALPEDTAERGDVVASELTGRDGATSPLPLSAPPKSNSQSPDAPSPPYAVYFIEVKKNGYYDATFLGVPIFDGITAIQTVHLIPVSENATQDGFSPYDSRIYETQSPNL